SRQYYIRKSHRFLGLLLGIQFVLWTVGGLYFSWSNMDEVHGDFERKRVPLLPSSDSLVSPTQVLRSISALHRIDSLVSLQVVDILGKPYYQVRCISALETNSSSIHHEEAMEHLADARTGTLRGPLSEQEAVQVAQRHFVVDAAVKKVEYIDATNGHHEYRSGPLPAYAIQFDHPSQAVVYVASSLGTVQKVRNDKWRIFDFLWMMHTMDYESRDEFGNTLLRVFSIFGLITVLSGFALFFTTSKWLKKSKGY
ncbi:MAG: hypothetical protein ACK43J_08420, partial [Chitinophagaceae bacterium]